MKRTQYVTASNGKRLRVDIEVKRLYYIIMVSDTRSPKLHGAALSNNGDYMDGSNQDPRLHPLRWTKIEDAAREARRQTALSRSVGLGRGHGIMHTLSRLDAWEQWQARRHAAKAAPGS